MSSRPSKAEPRSGLLITLVAVVLAAAWGLVRAPAYAGREFLGYHLGFIFGYGLMAGLVVGLVAFLLGLALRRKVGVFSLLAIVVAAILIPAAPVIVGETAGELLNGDVRKINNMARNTYIAQDRAYDAQISAIDFDASLNVPALAADRDFKTVREKIRRARKLMDDYRTQVRNRRPVLVATLEKKHVSARKQAEYLASYDAQIARTKSEMELLWELEDSFLIETEHLVDFLDRAKPEWDVKRELVFFKSRAELNTLQTYLKRLSILSEEMRKVRTHAVIVSSRPVSPPANRG